MGRLTLWGINQYQPLFDNIVLPEGLSNSDLVTCIMDRSGMLFPYHQEPPQLKLSIESWFRRRNNDFTRMYQAITAEYDPLHNYDRTETHDYTWQENGEDTTTRQAEGTDKSNSKNSGSDTTTQNGTETTSVAAFDSNTLQDRQQVTPDLSNTTNYGGIQDSSVTYGRKDTDKTEYGRGHTDNGTLRAYGNIGVTTSEQMLEQEMQLRIKYDVYLIIAQLFEDTFLCQVY